jgi:hypothetical protein
LPKSFSMKMRGGNLISPDRFMQLVQKPVQDAALVAQGGVQEASPVKEGTLRRSWTTSPAEQRGSRVVSRVGTNVVYARYQNTRTRNRGYVKRGIDRVKSRAKQVLAGGMAGVVEQMWGKG